MERNNTRKTNKNKNIKHENQTILLTNITQKNTRIAGKTAFFHRLTAKQERRQKQKHKTKQKTPKTKPKKKKKKQKTERLKHTHTH